MSDYTTLQAILKKHNKITYLYVKDYGDRFFSSLDDITSSIIIELADARQLKHIKDNGECQRIDVYMIDPTDQSLSLISSWQRSIGYYQRFNQVDQASKFNLSYIDYLIENDFFEIKGGF